MDLEVSNLSMILATNYEPLFRFSSRLIITWALKGMGMRIGLAGVRRKFAWETQGIKNVTYHRRDARIKTSLGRMHSTRTCRFGQQIR